MFHKHLVGLCVCVCMHVLFEFMLYVQVTNFSVMSVEPVLSSKVKVSCSKHITGDLSISSTGLDKQKLSG